MTLKRKTRLRATKGLQRKTPMRSAGLRSGTKEPGSQPRGEPKRTRVRPRNESRKAAARARNYDGPNGDHDAMIRSLPCAVCWSTAARTDPTAHCLGRTVAAHVTPRGMGGANGCWADLANLCVKHHAEAGEERTSERAVFEARYGIDLRQLADRHAQPVLGAVARRWLEAPASVPDVDRDALFRWLRRRKDDPGVWSIDGVGRALGLFANPRAHTDAEVYAIVRLCDAAMEGYGGM